MPRASALPTHELGLRQHPFGGIDQHDRPVHHVQDTLHLAAEIGMARRVDDVDPRIIPHHRGALRQDGDATLLLQVVAVQRPIRHLLMLPERARLAEQLVHQRGLPVIDMGDNSDVTNLHAVLAFGMVRRTLRR